MSRSTTALTDKAHGIIRTQPHHILALPEPPQKFKATDIQDDELTADLGSRLRYWQHIGIVDRVRRDYTASKGVYNVWRTDPTAYHRAQQLIDERNTHACGHSGIRNLGDGEYSCTNDDCDATYTRSEIEEVLD